MTLPWQQPIRPLEYKFQSDDYPTGWSPWMIVLFIRPTDNGWEIMGPSGVRWTEENAILRDVAA